MSALLNPEQKARAFSAFWVAYRDGGGEEERARAAAEYAAMPLTPEMAGTIVRQALLEGGSSAVPASTWLLDSWMEGYFDLHQASLGTSIDEGLETVPFC